MITGDVVDSTSIPIEKRAGLLECMSSVLDDIICLRTFDDGYDASLAPMSILV